MKSGLLHHVLQILLYFFSVYSSTTKDSSQIKSTKLWKLKNDDPTLEELLELKGHSGDIKCIMWNPSETTKSESVASLDENNIRFWKLDTPAAKV